MSKATKLFIVEGSDKDTRLIEALTKVFFVGKFETKIITLPADQNIYMLYNILKSDDFETDIVEVLRDSVETASDKLQDISRDDIDEVFLFFDFDAHQNNLNLNFGKSNEEVLLEMISEFDNETENGKLYISYPMVEALYDFIESTCLPFSSCECCLSDFANYKTSAGKNNPNASLHFIYTDWQKVLNVFGLRIQCLFNNSDLDFKFYRQNVTVETIMKKQLERLSETDKIFVLSAFPEFILDYFKNDFWNSHIKMKLSEINCKNK